MGCEMGSDQAGCLIDESLGLKRVRFLVLNRCFSLKKERFKQCPGNSMAIWHMKGSGWLIPPPGGWC
jgi:hypothetical protein